MVCFGNCNHLEDWNVECKVRVPQLHLNSNGFHIKRAKSSANSCTHYHGIAGLIGTDQWLLCDLCTSHSDAYNRHNVH